MGGRGGRLIRIMAACCWQFLQQPTPFPQNKCVPDGNPFAAEWFCKKNSPVDFDPNILCHQMIAFLRQLAELVKPYKVRLALGVLTGFIAGLLEPLMVVTVTFVFSVLFPSAGVGSIDQQLLKVETSLPAFTKHWVESIRAALPHGGSTPAVPVLILVVSAIPCVMLLRGLFGYLNVYLLQWAAVRAIADLRARLFTHLMSQSASFFSKTSTGELMSRVSGDTGALQGTISNSLQTVVKDPVTLLGFVSYLLWAQPKLTLISMIVLPVCVLPIAIYSRKIRHSAKAIQTHSAELNKLMVESFTGHRIIKAYNLESRVIDSFRDTADKFIGHFMRVVRSQEIPGPMLEFFGSIGVCLVLIYLAVENGGRANASDFLAIVFSIFSMYKPVKSLVRLHANLEQAKSASERVFALLATRSNIVEPAQPKPLRAAGADIRFEGISFNYGEKAVLSNITLNVKAGQLVALAGSSGSGKTTLSNLLLRFYDPQAGSIKIGGLDIREVALQDLRSQIAVVTQEVILFNDTIESNIALGRPGATKAEIEEAARHAHAHGFILEKPNGYQTKIGEKGVNLSGGQRQRLAIARAIVKDAPILILDEATSALDTESEHVVQEALEELMQGRTTICIAHRLSTIQKANLIVVMDQGRIVEQGTHTELLTRGGHYQKLYELQFRT